MSESEQVFLFVDMLIAGAFAVVIGYDREQRGKAAGLRTHILVAVGACLFTVLSQNGFPGSDTSRVAAAVVSGIGFLGAGVIFKDNDEVHGLTTAASIWVTAAVGMAVGAGAWVLGLLTTIAVWIVLYVLKRIKEAHIED
ncbi:MgtC/SapB family protein [Phototrophicus methaneseepsis]|uniref:MgtC/SapB family protein n=1 Tax=Phototrophicus methaneseepsis TaxID=2710758 RepID=A0A7S8EBQ5_9CHLR|nr:MgtC/SapB family protein [Phototrophicus methaneseepsis]QPC84055.1 MgtC/SapB family protein [Phototrophicus methaneseepsis]